MRKTRSRFIGLTLAWSAVTVIAIFLLAPPVLYQYAIGSMENMPDKPAILLSQEETAELWVANEICKPEKCASITPYWIYRWLLVAVFNDYLRPLKLDAPYRNVSKMAARIAIDHMRKGHYKGKGMLGWHFTHACLGIWVQRNWSTHEIATRYRLINA